MADAMIQRDRLFSLFREMVDIYSPSGREEELATFLAGYLREQGLPVEMQPVDETRCNLLVGAGRGVPDTLFLGHIDTVPAFDIEEFEFSEKGGLCSGLGTADMKGGCAALIEAFVAVAQAGALPDGVLLALVVGEEETGDGTQALLADHSFESALVAEPTDLQLCLSHYGYVEMWVQAFGYRRHAAMSGRETNAIRALLRFLLQLEDRIEKEEPQTVMNIRDLHSSESGFAVPDQCGAYIDLHIPPWEPSMPYAAKMARFAKERLSKTGASRCEIEFPTQADGYRISDAESIPMVRALQEVLREAGQVRPVESFKSHSDANLLKQAGCQPVLFGPGQLAKAHTADESIDFAHVVMAARILTAMLNRLHRPG